MRSTIESAKRPFARILTVLGFSQAEGRDADVEQAFLRVLVTSIVLVYGTAVGLSDGSFSLELRVALACGCVTGSAGLWMLYRFHRYPTRSGFMRSFGIAADIIPITAGLFFAGEIGVPLVGLYLWITVGNGFRFGPRYLLQSYSLSGVCFTLLLLFSPFWQQHREIGIGLAILLGTIPIYVLILLSRITAQKDAAEQLSNAKSRFVANVSHELRTPLTGVVAVHDLLLRRPLSTTDRELVDTLGSAIQALKTSVDAILQMSKLEAGAELVTWHRFNLRAYLRQLEVQIAPSAKAKGLEWQVKVYDEVPGLVVGDQSHLDHVVGNLINNALKFTLSGGVRLQVSKSGPNIRFEVVDTGVGIPLDQQEHIFERFVQADASATRRFGGTGLGTSIAHDLVTLMGGRIGVSSIEGSGSTFWFELPMCAQEHECSQETPIADNRDVYVISENLLEAKKISQCLGEHGLNPSLVLPLAASEADFSQGSTLTAVLVMSPSAAIAFAERHLCRPNCCPWLLVALTEATPADLSRLWQAGSLDILPVSEQAERVHQAIRGLTPFIESRPTSRAESVVRRRILIADDNQSNLLLITRILEEAGHSVRAVERGDIAYDLMMSGQFDVALLDYNMPEMTGPDAVKLFRAGETGGIERLPILIVSADASPDARRDSIQAGADGHLLKPVPAAELERVAKLTAGRPVRIERRATKRDYPKLVSTNARRDVAPKAQARDLVERALLDPVRFEELRKIANNDADFMRRYAAASFLDIEAALVELRSALAAMDSQAARDALHKIDGTAVNLGATAVAQASIRMKTHLSNLQGSAAAKAAAEIASTCALTKSAITAALEGITSRSDAG
ncbi:MAG: response regulator [Betaproteobacteria bacterium]|nr:response regulator [Betaproteobacteria bacterium]